MNIILLGTLNDGLVRGLNSFIKLDFGFYFK